MEVIEKEKVITHYYTVFFVQEPDRYYEFIGVMEEQIPKGAQVKIRYKQEVTCTALVLGQVLSVMHSKADTELLQILK